MLRTIKQVVTGSRQEDGAGVKLVRVLSGPNIHDFDPFLMLDAFNSTNPDDYTKGFPWHPHRGIETITYLIKGKIEHGDSIGNKGVINNGCCQWMTAGSGIMHQEMPKTAPHMLGFQLWLNLPKKNKMSEPKYHDIKENMIPKVKEDGATIGVIAGHYKHTIAAMQGEYVRIHLLDVELAPNVSWKLDTHDDETLFVYIVEGEGYFADDTTLQASKRAILFNLGDEFMAKSTSKGMRFILASGMPIKEPIAWGGPIVMNTKQELREAFQELNDGTFIKK